MNSRKVITNAGWIIACRILQAILQLIVSMMTARYLGPSNYGLINYAASLVAFVIPIMQLGLNAVLVQEIINKEVSDGEIIGTALAMCMSSAGPCILGVILFVMTVNGDEQITIIVCALYCTVLLFQVFEVIQYWFQAKLMSKYTSMLSLVAYFLVSVYKICILVSAKNIYWFAVSNALDYLIIGIGLIILYNHFSDKTLKVSKTTAVRMFKKSRYYIVSALMVMVFTQTDRIMLKLMIGNAATGFYSAAVACAGMTGFVFTAVIDSARPVIFESKKMNNKIYEGKLVKLYSIVIYMSLVQSVCITIFAKYIIVLLYGSQYGTSVPVLRIIVWYTTFSYIGAVRNIWILAENKQRYLWIINASGAFMNILLNLILIPFGGITGAAWASLITQFFTNFLLSYMIRPIINNNGFIIKSLNPLCFTDTLKKLFKIMFDRFIG